MPRLFENAKKKWKRVVFFIILSIVFWLVEFGYQFYVVSEGLFGASIIRSFAFSGATFIGLSLLLSVVFKFKPVYRKYWTERRNLGVMGTVFVFIHILAAISIYYMGSLPALVWSFDPFRNPLIFGILGIIIFFPPFITSADWMVFKLGGKNWKRVQNLVHPAYLVAVLHYLTQAPRELNNLAGYLLLFVTALVLAG
ncbi:MAG: ferric reductase-like transmembrane domain-containing protein, partial [Nanoarchaeota archaeon]|nr:ferric reductase-like transmembrane domain-containing protein [Nanoarchaeota archaeon]